MQKKQSTFIIFLTCVVAVFLAVYVGRTIRSVNESVTQACFNELVSSSKRLSDELYDTTDMDRTILNAMAAIISNSGVSDDARLSEIMKSYNSSASYVSYVELLRPDNTLLAADGTVRDVTGDFDFSQEAEKGTYISDITQSTLDPDEKVIRNAVPVVKNEETIYMLYGVVRLSEFAQRYTTDIYNGHAYVYLMDGNTGDFLLDTWHNSFGNVNDFSKRKMLGNYNFEEAIDNMKQGVGGDLGFVSKTTNNILYMHYEPVGINNWSVIVTVEKKYALDESETISSRLYGMAFVIGVVMLIYMMYMLYHLLKEYRYVRKLGMEDQTTGLQNRNAFDNFMVSGQSKYFESIVCIYADANGLHEINNRYGHQAGDQMLRSIADALKKEFSDQEIYRVGGDEFVVLCETSSMDSCSEKMEKVNQEITSHDYSISYGVVCREKENGIDRVTKEADEKMLENKRLYYGKHDRRMRE